MSIVDALGDVEAQSGTAKNLARLGIAVILGSYAVNAMDRALFPVILPEVRSEYGFGLSEAGLMSTVFTVGMAFSGAPTGFLMARYARKSVAQIGIVIFSAATVLTVLASGFADMLLYRAVTGVGEAMQLTAVLTILSSYFRRNRGAGAGAVNCAFGIGNIIGPLLGAALLSAYGTWRAPMLGFGLIGFVLTALVAVLVRRSLSEVKVESGTASVAVGGAQTLMNRNTIVLVLLSLLAGIVLWGYLGMYPTYLREQLQYAPADAGKIMSIYGIGTLLSVAGGLIGDRFPIRPVLAASFLSSAAASWLLFNGPADFAAQAALSFVAGATLSGTIYVNLAGYHVKAVRGELAGQASGIFVTTFYAAAAFSGYTIGWLASQFGWVLAGDIQLCGTCLAGAVLVMALDPARMAQPSRRIA